MGCLAVVVLAVAGASVILVEEGMPSWGVPVFVAGAAWMIGSLALAVLGTATDGAHKKPATLRRLLRNWLLIVTTVVWVPLWMPFGRPLERARRRARAAREQDSRQDDWSSRRTRF